MKLKHTTIGTIITTLTLTALPSAAQLSSGSNIALRSIGNGRIVSADEKLGPEYPLAANRNQINSWETFEVINAGGGAIAFYNEAHGRFVSADRHLDATNWRLAANRTKVGSWEKFFPIDRGNGIYSFRANGNGDVIRTDRNLDTTNWRVAANRPANSNLGSWTQFEIESVSGGNGGDIPGGLNKNGAPSDNFQLKDWKLTLPSANEIKENDLSDGYEGSDFYTDSSTGGMVFKVSAQASSTINSTYARCELREMLREGNTSISTTGINGNNWVIDTASNSNKNKAGGVNGTLTGTLRVDRVTTGGNDNQVGRVIIGQIHGEDDEPCRLYYRKLPGNSKGSIYFASEEWQGDDEWFEMIGSRSDNASNPSDGIAIGEVFSYKIDLDGRKLTVSIMRDGKSTVTKTHTIDNEYDGDWFYFRAGAYIQDNTAPSGEFAQVTFFDLDNAHD